MPRIDMKTSDWHKLIKPVIPHAATDADTPELACVRLEASGGCVYAIATDRYTLAVERHQLGDYEQPAEPLHIALTDAKSSLSLFPFSKDDDPSLRITVDRVAKPVHTRYGREITVDHLGVTIDSEYGTRLVMHDVRDPSRDAHSHWSKSLHKATLRTMGHTPVPPRALTVAAIQLGKWAAAVRKGERLAMYQGDEHDRVVLVLVEKHFAGLWMQVDYIDGPDKMLGESPWRDELAPVLDDDDD
jgi:hypothetical protein